MKPLPKQFIGRGEVKGFRFTQIQATDMAYLYKVEANAAIYYEVFKKRENARFCVISYPTSEAFGYWAWTYRNYEKAMNKFYELNKTENDEKAK